MSWIIIIWTSMATFSATIAGIYLAAWLMQRNDWAYLLFVLLAVSIAFIAATELRMLRAQTPQDYATALRWLHIPVWSGFLALVGLVQLRLRPRFSWVGWLAVGLRTVSLIANFASGPNLNYVALTGLEHLWLLGEPVATATGGIPNPWMLTGQASLVLSILFLVDGGVSTWRRGEGIRSLVLTVSLLFPVLVGTVQAVLVFWGLVRLPFMITPFFLSIAAVMGSELSLGLLRAARAERDVRIKNAALDVSEQRLSLAAEAADAGFWGLDAQSGNTWTTAKTRELFGLADAEHLRLSDFLQRVHPQDRAPLQQLIETTLYSKDSFRSEFRVIDPGGGVRWLAGLGRGVAATDQGPTTLMGVSIDITERKAMQSELRRQRARLERVSKSKTMSELSTFLAHELNQPLAMIMTNAEAARALLIREPPNLTEIGEILTDILAADRRAADVIQHLRSFLEHGEPHLEALSLNDAIQRVLGVLRNELDDQSVTVTTRLTAGLPRLRADRVLIEQVLLNLLNNACVAVADNPPDERQVSIGTQMLDNRFLVTMMDNGHGVSDPERIFDPFYSTTPGGLGMGLAIVRSIVSSHGGRVWAESLPTGGARVKIDLPSVDAAS